MGIKVKPGTRLLSVTCDAEIIVVRAPDSDVELTIGGETPAITPEEREQRRSELRDEHGGGVLVGKRYGDATATLEVLCTRAGDGVVALDGVPLEQRAAKSLPSSD